MVGAEPRESSTLHRAVRILSFLAEYGTHSSIRELSAGVELPRSTVHRICQMLAREGILALNEQTRQYQWGPELLRISRAAYQSTRVRQLALPVLTSVMQECDETALLVLYDRVRRQAVFTDEVECDQPVRYHAPMQVPVPVYAGASGKGIMAFLPEEEIDAIISDGLEPLTENTVTDPAQLRRELERVRAEGYATSHGERITGAVGIGAPVFDADGRVTGQLHVTVPEYRSTPDLDRRVVASVVAGAERISRLMGLPEEVACPPTRQEQRRLLERVS
jgi:IclR family acetate operon transcriptional repressor